MAAHPNQGKHPRAGQRAAKCDAYADRLAEHGDRHRATRELGISDSYGRVLWGIIVKGLGWQAS